MLDTSTLISLARSGLLRLLEDALFTPVILDVVVHEAVVAGVAGGHADAFAIASVLRGRPVVESPRAVSSADAAVLDEARRVGVLIANDLALGRRARNLGATWLRTADLVVWLLAEGRLSKSAARAALISLRDAGRITNVLADAYLEEIE